MAEIPQSVFGDFAPSLCSLGPRAVLLTGFFREWLTTHFSREATIEHPELRSKLWSSLDSTKILIESITRFAPRTTEKRPAVIVRRDEWAVEHRGIGDQMQLGFDWTGADHYATFVRGSHTLFCLSPNAPEAETLAAEVYREFNQFSRVIREAMGLMRFAVAGCGALAELEEAHETYVVPVTVGYCFEEKWRLIPHAPYLKSVRLSVLAP